MSRDQEIWEQLCEINTQLHELSQCPQLERAPTYDDELLQLQRQVHEYADMWTEGDFMLPPCAHLTQRTNYLKHVVTSDQDGSALRAVASPPLLPESLRALPDSMRGAVCTLRARPPMLPSPLRRVSHPVPDAASGHECAPCR